MVRIKFAGDEWLDFPAEQCATTDWSTALQYPDKVIIVEGDADDPLNASHVLYVPVRSIAAVETYPTPEPEPQEATTTKLPGVRPFA